MAAMTKIQFATLTAVLGLATMGGVGYIAYANTSPHDTGGNNAAVVSGGQGANGSGTTQANGSSGQGGGSDTGKNGATGGSSDSGSGDSGDDNADAPCVNGDVQVAESPGEGAAGHVSLLLVFRNVSGHACRLQGYPGASLVDETGKDLLDAKRTLSGYAGGAVGLQKAPDVLLAANGKASAVLEWSDVPDSSQPGGCDVQSAASLLVSPPNFTQSTTLNLGAGAAVCSDFQIHPVLQGVVSEPGSA